MHLAVRADGGPDIGYGHLMRSSALTERLVDDGHTVTFATTTPDTAEAVCPAGIDSVTLPSREDPAPFVAWLSSSDCDVVFCDAYPAGAAYQAAVREHSPVAVTRDTADCPVCADVFVNGNLYASELSYTVRGDPPEWCLGPEYALLRREISELAAKAPPWRPDPERALVTFGGSDVRGFTPRAIRAFEGVDIAVDVVVGPGFSNVGAIETAADAVSVPVTIHQDPPSLPTLMFEADLAVSATGTTTYELLALGTPMVAVPQVDNQLPIANALADRDLATVLPQDADQALVTDAIERRVNDTKTRRNHCERGREVVDGLGTARIGKHLLELASHSDV